MSRPDGAGEAAKPGRRPPRRLVRARRRLRADLVQLLGAAAGLVMGLTIPRVNHGPTVDAGRLAELLFTLGIGVVGVTTVVFSLLFGVVQWSSSSFSPRLGLFREDPLVWRTFGFGIGVFVFSVTAGLSSGNAGRVSLLVPLTAVLAALIALLAIRALQARAFLSMQLPLVLAAVAVRGRAVIGDLYPVLSAGAAGDAAPAEAPPGPSRTVAWPGAAAVVQQLNLRRLVDEAARANVLVVFRVSVGESLHEAAPLADVHGGDLPDRVVRAAVVRGVERSFEQDPMLAFRLLADIGLRALSPAVNDPATAVDAMEATEGLLQALARRGCSPTCWRCPHPAVTHRFSGWLSRSRTVSQRAGPWIPNHGVPSLEVVAVDRVISAAALRRRDTCAGGHVSDRTAALRPSGGGCSAVARGEGSCAHAVSQDAEEHRQPDNGDGLLCSLAEPLEGKQGEKEGCQASRAEPADEQDRVPVKTGADGRQSDGDHPRGGQAEHGVQQGGQPHPVKHEGYGDGAERQPDEQGDQATDLVQELELGGPSGSSRNTQRQPAGERRDEPVPVQENRTEVGEDGKGEDRDASEALGGPASAARPP
jgi:hypothetical protein